ncbi:hypothetical protein O181_086359 [Austropuccinia psidii MF-1]|uniref:Uncharacterized protein n=1 Tax=Austropuccinia psidii MF-1 TaxID=1389203 RepID=A0A9Q3FWU3_9BASI|nr:hypothetical protein [Austropuccinia psidii MF-1]
MMLLTAEWSKSNPPPPKTSAKTNPSGQKKQFQFEKEAKRSEQGQGKSTSHKAIQPWLHNIKDSTRCHGECVLDGQNHDGISEKRGSHIKTPEIISEILDGI